MSDKENDIDLELKNDLRKWQGLPLKACGDDAHVATSPITPLPAPVITLGTNRHNSDNATSDWVSSVPTGTTPSKSTLSESSPIHTTAAMETPPLPGPETPPIPSSPQTDDVLPTVELQPPPDHDAVDYDNMDLNDVPTPGGPYSQSPAAPSKPVQITPSVASKDLTPERDETPTPVAGPKKKGIAGKDKTPPKARDNPKHTGDTTESNEDAYAPSPPSVKGKGNVKTPVKAIDASKHTGDTTESAEDAGDPTPRPTIKGKGKAALKSKVTLQKTPFEGKGASTGGTTSKKRGKAAGASDDEELESPAKKQKSTSAKQKTPAKAKTMNVDSDEDKPANMVKRKGRAAARPVKDRNRKAPVDINPRVPFPKSFDDATEADKELVRMVAAREADPDAYTWEQVNNRWGELSGHDPKKSTLPNRANRLQAIFTTVRGEDIVHFIAAKREVEIAWNSQRWIMIADTLQKKVGFRYPPNVLKAQYEKIVVENRELIASAGEARKGAVGAKDAKGGGDEEEIEEDEEG